MRWPETGAPVRMQRVALVSAPAGLRDALVTVAAAGTVQLDALAVGTAPGHGAARERLQELHATGPTTRRLARRPPDLEELSRAGRSDLLAGEAEVQDLAAAAIVRGDLAALAGWAPVAALPELTRQLAQGGSSLCRIDAPRGIDPPTLLRPGGQVRRSFAPLVDTYATVPYVDVDPTLVAGAAYVVMFGMMFGDAGDGLLLVLLGLLLRAGRPRWAAGARRVWPFVVASGLAATVFGLLYGEFFGPTGVVPVLWVRPLDHPVTLLAAALGVGGVLLSGAYAVGTVNRWREGGWALALVSAAGLAGAAVFFGAGAVLLGLAVGTAWVTTAGAVVGLAGLVLCFVGFLAAAGGGPAGATQASVELFDATLRLGANVVSFARLAAFGLTHAALGLIVWQLTTALWDDAGPGWVLAVAAFLVGNAVAFALEALIAAVQALRLSYYELFSRVFAAEGSPFRPWHIPVEETASVPVEVGGSP